MSRTLKVFFSCSGVGILNRGIESFFREAFDGLRGTEGLDITLYKGAGEPKADERLLWNLPRTGTMAQFLGKCVRRNGYVVEQLSSFPSMVRDIRRERPDLIFYSDSNLGFQLFRWRQQIGVPYRLLFSNGGPCHPPFNRTDSVHQVAPQYYDEALAAGEPREKHFLVPYGINVPDGAPDVSVEARRAARQKLGLPQDRPIVISVGWIAAKHKRMDHVIRELARMTEMLKSRDSENLKPERVAQPALISAFQRFSVSAFAQPFLVLLGQMDEQSPAIVELAKRELGEGNFMARSVPYEQVSDFYRAADVFTLASLQEGFGRVYLEALIHGLPVIAHDHPVMRYVLGDQGRLIDMAKPSALAEALREQLSQPNTPEAAARRRESVRARFSWPALRAAYREMFYAAAREKLKH